LLDLAADRVEAVRTEPTATSVTHPGFEGSRSKMWKIWGTALAASGFVAGPVGSGTVPEAGWETTLDGEGGRFSTGTADCGWLMSKSFARDSNQ
jgi:hypothetical protein